MRDGRDVVAIVEMDIGSALAVGLATPFFDSIFSAGAAELIRFFSRR
jgi:hypothetical protein